MKNKNKRVASWLVAGIVGALALTACGAHDKKFHAKSDSIQCIYDRNGVQKKILPAGSDTYDGDDRDQVFEVPVSDRFYNIDPNDAIRDAGAPKFVTGFSAGDKDVQMVVHFHFKLNQSLACPDFVDQHMKRNIPPSVIKDSDITDKMGFNVRNLEDGLRYGVSGGSPEETLAKVPWANFLNSRMAPSAQKTGAPILKSYEKFALQFNYPVNANEEGLLPCAALNNDGSVADPVVADLDQSKLETCANRVPADIPTYTQMEQIMSPIFTAELNARLGGNYFCGVAYTPKNPTVCPNIDIEIVQVSLVDTTPVAARQALDTQRDVNANAEAKAVLDNAARVTADNAANAAAEAALAQTKLKIANDAQVRDAQNADKVAAAESELAVVNAQAALTAAKTADDATVKIAPCLQAAAAGIQVNCELLLSILAGGSYPVGNNTTSVSVGSTP